MFSPPTAMPELPEVEVLVQHLHASLTDRVIRSLAVHRPKVIRPATADQLRRHLVGCRFRAVERRAKYLVFHLSAPRPPQQRRLLGHLGMTGRLFLLPARSPAPRHCVVELILDRDRLIFEDMRLFGRLTTDLSPLQALGPEPLGRDFTPAALANALRSNQPIKVRLLDQQAIAGIGNIYASEALFLARLHPAQPARTLAPASIRRLHRSLQRVLREAIRCGSTVPLDWAGEGARDGLFYYGQAAGSPGSYEERLRVYDRAGQPCPRCRTDITRIVQAGRSTFYCARCQPAP